MAVEWNGSGASEHYVDRFDVAALVVVVVATAVMFECYSTD